MPTRPGQAVSAIDALSGSGRAADAVDLAREAMRLLAEAAESVDDSDGRLGRIGAALADTHLGACRAARPVPEELARWLAGHVLGDLDDGLTDIDPLDHEDVLGEAGMAALRESAVRSWRANPRGWAEKRLVEHLAGAGGHVDTVIAVHAADLSPDGRTHLVIARELDAAGGQLPHRSDRALCRCQGHTDGRSRARDVNNHRVTFPPTQGSSAGRVAYGQSHARLRREDARRPRHARR